jgi:hypothetical protein
MKNLLLCALFLAALPTANQEIMKTRKLYKKLTQYCATLPEEFSRISAERRQKLEELGDYIAEKSQAGQALTFNVICTHNSRRSHIGQLWMLAAAAWYGIENVNAFSGGTEATAFNERAVAALKRAGFKIERLNAVTNATYQASYGSSFAPKAMFSKKYDDAVNPRKNFAAVMVCSEADASCPIVPGAEERFSLPYEDPKYFDNTASEKEKYDETCRLIGREIFYTMSYAKQKLVVEQEKNKATSVN